MHCFLAFAVLVVLAVVAIGVEDGLYPFGDFLQMTQLLLKDAAKTKISDLQMLPTAKSVQPMLAWLWNFLSFLNLHCSSQGRKETRTDLSFPCLDCWGRFR